ncbi:hypothetical protein H9L10_09560 [Phycicoccus endophyticus]|uniref:Zf-HC2 domain-containing protein n=1 Tax=Phycicoccus endophyticus TaxID=1690220 RepID=A0A7G9QYZ1_9MICO|nr:hypothetical protein [Phycicoccus endophyticus]NHI18904.1 hypothetical protein [Phycicoccus endophyticus]QNN48566.1 hypothetical protein H9L10_09560 [Phycicoccus endophyticus]GGL31263.1 hypothetical protein GCM10012283_12010 [Phycicoccus endophyticus]
MTAHAAVRCGSEELSEYAAGRLSAERSLAWDRHLVACQVCRQDVDDERRLRQALAGAPSMPGDLRVTLLALGRQVEPVASTPREPLTLLAPGAPPCHRSALRATVVAAAAAGVSAAAAWSLTVIGTPVPERPGVVSGTLPATTTVGGGAAGSSASFVPAGWPLRTSSPTSTGQQAQSTP